MSEVNGDHRRALAHAAVGAHLNSMTAVVERLDAIRKELTSGGLTSLVVTDEEVHPSIQKDWPIEGAERAIVQRTPDGGLFTVTTTVGVLWPANENRLGLRIVNRGAVGVTLFLGGVVHTSGGPIAGSTLGTGQVWLAALGGSWDGQLGQVLWGGSLLAQADSASTTVTVSDC